MNNLINKPEPVTKEEFKKLVSKDKWWMWEVFKENTCVYYYKDNPTKPYFMSKNKHNNTD